MEWVSVDDGLPMEGEEVLVWVIYYEDSPDEMERFSDSVIEDKVWLMGSAEHFRVTHWARVARPAALQH